jgi:hypothetical protein
VTFSPLETPFDSRRFDRERLARGGQAVEATNGMELVSLGRPLTDFALKVVDDDGRELGPDQVGRLLVSGPSLMEGYLHQPEATAAVLRDGWLDTGDLGFVHDGLLFLTGRAKDVLILHGRNHSPHEVEDAVGVVPGVRAGCAIAVSWLPEDGTGTPVAARGSSAGGGRDRVPASRPRAPPRRAPPAPARPRRGARPGDPAQDLIRKAAPVRDAAPVAGGRARSAGRRHTAARAGRRRPLAPGLCENATGAR